MSEEHYSLPADCTNCGAREIVVLDKRVTFDKGKPPCKRCGCDELVRVIL